MVQCAMATENTMPERLSYIRCLLGMSQAEIAEKLGVTRQTIGLYENGKRVPDAIFVKNFARITGCSLNYLYGLEKEFGKLINGMAGRKIIARGQSGTTFEKLLADREFLQIIHLIDLAPHHITEHGYVDPYLRAVCHELLDTVLEKSVKKITFSDGEG